ncbi:MAG TPA: monodechloroaminopyrrolnitrin synthase PrnB family protein [Vicinamibacterales bacterium]|nr:monodechloroaminopyrrolnitrin synthase PrnB family protein [Vicinamibacterales bacterium]
MHDPIERLDAWLRTDFIRINTALEDAYFADRVDVIHGRPALDALKLDLLRQGGALMEALVDAALPDRPNARYRLLGLVGHYLAACQRHEAPLSDQQGARHAAWLVSTRIGASLNVVPRLVFAHQSLFNESVDGRFRTFTALPDEEIFIRLNALGVVAYQRAADALHGVSDAGVTSAVASYLLDGAEAALLDVLRFNQDLSKQLNVERFFFNIRPYFKTYRVGERDYRGANAGDFSAINEIDVTLGLCRMDDHFYRAIVDEKLSHVPPDDRRTLETLDQRRSLLDAFIRELELYGPTARWKANVDRFLRVCKAHGAGYAHHHNRLVKAYVEAPSKTMASAHSAGITSSGPPLGELMAMLQRLSDLRLGRGPQRAQLERLAAAAR